jgi:hypothetical protein
MPFILKYRVEHSFVLININGTIYIVDAYEKLRTREYRIFNFDQFFKLLYDLYYICLWNILFKCNEDTTHIYNNITLAIRF